MKDDEDVSLIRFFSLKKDKKKEKTKKESNDKFSEQDISLNFKALFQFLLKNYSFFFVLIALIILTYIRLIPYNMSITDEWARRSIEQNIKNNIASQIAQQYPNLPQQSMMPMVEEQYKLVVSQQKDAIENAVKQNSLLLKQYFRDEKGHTYLGDIDSYYWLRYARNIVEKGHIEDEKRDNILIDNHMTAPIGFVVDVNIYPYFIAYFYKILKFFNPDLSLMQASFFTPIILSFFAVIIAFLLGKKLSGNLAGFIAGILIATNPTLLSRSLGSDNDIVNVIFPLLIMLFSVYAFDTEDLIKKSIFSALAGLFIGIYSFAWSGWWFIFLFLIVASIIYLGYVFIYELFDINNTKNKKINFLKSFFKNQTIIGIFLFLFVFLAFSYIGLSLFENQDLFFKSFTNPFGIIRLKQAAKPNLWPNVYTTVAEMNEADFNQVVSGFGGVFFILLGFLGSIISLVSFENKNRNISLLFLLISTFYYLFVINIANNVSAYFLMALISLPMFIGLILSVLFKYTVEPMHSILLVIWFMATIYASLKGVRFILLIMPAFVISFSVFFSQLNNKLSIFLSKLLDIKPIITKSLIFFVILLFLIQPIRQGYVTAYNYIPSVNDAWVETLTKIRLESKENAIINSWWDFGHWFKYFADRAVTFDGASQNKPTAHWIGKVLLTDNENQAIAILRMLDCGSNNAYSYIYEELNDTHESVKLVYKLLNMSKDQAAIELKKSYSEEKVNKILNAMYCEPPENYFITSEDMVGKSGVWAHFGSWNFERADYYNYFRTNDYNGFINNVRKEYNLSEEEVKRIYYELASKTTDRAINDWIAPWPGYMGSVNCNEKTQILQCNIPVSNNQVVPLVINLTNFEPRINVNQGDFKPNAFAYVNGDNYVVKRYDENKFGYAVALLPNNRTLILMSEELIGSLFTRLFYFDGLGLKHFDKFHDVTDITGLRIITWKVNWDGEK